MIKATCPLLQLSREVMGSSRKNDSNRTTASPSEAEIIRWIRSRPQHDLPSLAVGIGDDAAVLRCPEGKNLVLSTDSLVENIHFRLDWTTPKLLAVKALATNLSDLAAMGAKPLACLLSLSLPTNLSASFSKHFLREFLLKAQSWNLALIGGNLSRAPGIQISLTVVGTVNEEGALLRSGAKPDDIVVVGGSLGLAAIGLGLLGIGLNRKLLSARRLREKGFWQRSVRAQLSPEPLLELAAWLQKRKVAHALTDISDGLSTDLSNLARESSLSAILDGNQISRLATQFQNEAVRQATRVKTKKLSKALANLKHSYLTGQILRGGEDYSLLFTTSAEKMRQIKASYPDHFPTLEIVGHLESGRPGEIWMLQNGSRRQLRRPGFDHFKNSA